MSHKKITVNLYIKKNTVQILLWLIFTAALGFFAPLKAFNLQWIIDSENGKTAVYYLILGLLVILASHLFEFLSRRLYTDIACKSLEAIRNQIMNKVMQRSIEDYDRQEDSAYISLLTNDMRTLYDDYFMAIFDIVFWGAILACALGMYIYINPVLLIVILLVSIPPLVLPKFMQARLKRRREEFSLEMAEYTKQMKDILGGFETIHAFMREKYYGFLHEKASKENSASESRVQQGMNTMMVASSLLSNGTFIVVLFFGMLLVFNGKITMGYMVTASSLANFVTSPCKIISQNYAKLKATKGIRLRIEELMNREMPEQNKTVMQLNQIDEIACQNVNFVYPGTQKIILDNLNLNVHKQEKIAIIGKSGCGKSTFAKLLYQYYQNYSGEILVNGNELKQISCAALYSQIGYISQKTFLFHDTIRNNICLYQEFTDAQIEKAIRIAGLQEYIASLPEGLNTQISENGKNLSGGQVQRIGIARMAIRNYSVVIADEITASLDAKTTEEIMENLFALDKMLIVITHDTQNAFMKRFDRIYKMENGKVL